MQTFHSQEDFELIEGYLDGSLDPEKAEEIRVRILSNNDFAARVAEISDLQLGVQIAALASKLDSFHTEITTQERQVPVRKLTTFQFWGVAASFFLLITAGMWWMMDRKSPGEELYRAYYQVDPGLVTSMSGEENYEFDRGMVDYKSGEYAKSLEFWKPLLEQFPANDTLLYFVSLDYLHLGLSEEAKKLLERVIEDNNSQFVPDANWYLGLVLVKEGRFNDAIPYLEASQKLAAKSLLSEIEKRKK